MSLRSKFFLFFVSFLVCFATYLYMKNDKKEVSVSKEIKCDLNKEDCYYNFEGRKVMVSISPKPMNSLQKLNLKIKNLPDYDDPKLMIYGLNMYMGDLNLKLKKVSKDTYESDFTLSHCFLDKMIFRAQILDEDKKKFYFDFEIQR